MSLIMHHVNRLRKHNYSSGDFDPKGKRVHTPDMALVHIRKARGLSQVELADMAGLTQPTLSRAENMDDGSTLGTYKALAEALNVPLADLFSDERTVVEQSLVRMFRQLPRERQQGWIDMAVVALGDPGQPYQETAQAAPASSRQVTD